MTAPEYHQVNYPAASCGTSNILADRPPSDRFLADRSLTDRSLTDRFLAARQAVRESSPLIHSITSPIAINDCANGVLALGAKPIMAEHPAEVAQITGMAQALTVSLANITDVRAESIMISGRIKPAVIDVVGVTCSPFRMELAKRFVEDCHPAVIKGNVSEIRAMAGADFIASGIDVSQADAVAKDNQESQLKMADIMRRYAASAQAVVMASGEVDIIAAADGEAVYFVKNGTAHMAKITGTGCMLTCITGVYLSVTDPVTASVLAAVTLGIAGEKADSSRGLGSYHIGLMDALSTLTDDQLMELMQVTEHLPA